MNIPVEIDNILETMKSEGWQAYLVGGCVRDLLMGRTPKDWDITTNASPEMIQTLFPENIYENNFGTVVVKTNATDPALKLVEITPYRREGKYSDKRHPDEVQFVNNLEEDLSRRDFTINSLAMGQDKKLVDKFQGQEDIEKKLIRTVGSPEDRFSEDALRLLRAVRLACELDFRIEDKTFQALKSESNLIVQISWERIRDEIIKLVMSTNPEKGFNLLSETGLLENILPELAEGVNQSQNRHHIYNVFDHSIKSLQYAAEQDYTLEVRLAALLHDIGKPRTRGEKDGDYTFYGHEIVGSEMARRALTRLHLPSQVTEKVTHLIRHHMFYYDIEKVSEAGARRLLARVGEENWEDLIKLRMSERIGSGVPKAEPYRLRHLQFLVDKAKQAPITTSQLAIDGNVLMQELNLPAGPKIGGILNALLSEVLDEPSLNNREYLIERAKKLKDADPSELKKMGQDAVAEAEKLREEEIKQKYRV